MTIDALSPEFAVGQRYLSDTEAELGLGVVIDVDDRCVHILFAQSEETRVYAKNSAPLSRVTFKEGDEICDQEGNGYRVTGLDQVMGVIKYHVEGLDGSEKKPIMETRLAANITLAKPLERLLAGRVEHGDWYELRQDILRMQSALAAHPLKGLMGARIDIIPHQLYIAHEVGKRIAPRVLLADEVGLGKTIEAGMIIHQQLLTGRAERVLILVPDSLQYQWMVELRRRFNLNFALFDLVRTAAIKEHNPEQNVFATEQCIIASIDLLLDHHDLYEQALEAGFDLLVVDEAHHLHWDSEHGGNDKYELVADFSHETPGVILLTATPEQLGIESHFARLRLLDADRFDDIDDFIAGQDAFAETASVAEILMDEKPLSEAQIKALTHLLGLDDPNDLATINDDEKLRTSALNQLLDRHGTGRVLFRNTRDSIQGFHGRTCHPHPLPLPNTWVDSYQTCGKLREQLWGEENQPDGGWLEDDPRVPWLIELLKGELKQQKVLLIARSGATVESLEAALRLHAGIKTAIFTEQMSLLERDQAAAFFADYEGAQILLCSEIGSEGRNFQFASHLVLWDLPANPDTLEQRIGRLDRIGQTQKISLHVPFVKGTAQERMFKWYDGALNIFNQISPAAQTVQEQFIVELKPLLEGENTDDNSQALDSLINEAANLRKALETELQSGRDRLLEYNSCRPRVAARIADAMSDFDANNLLPSFFERFFSQANLEHSIQRDGSWVIHPLEANSSQHDDIENLPIPEEGMTITFKRSQALLREDMDFITHEHPLMLSIYEMANSGTFGNTTVAMLKSNTVPEGMLLLEVNFRVTTIAPKVLNLSATLPTQVLRVFLSEQGSDFSERITPDMIMPHIERLDKNRARQVVKVRSQVIEDRYHDADAIAQSKLPAITEQALARFSQVWQREISRLKQLQKVNPNVRDEEIERLELLKAQGEQAINNLSLVPDSIRILVAVKP